MMPQNCVIIDNTVTAILIVGMVANANMCLTGDGSNVNPILPQHLPLSGTLTTTNFIIANWSREMWQGVVNRVAQTLASVPFGANFFSALATVA
uniref:Amino acid transporter n=1 Tax=Angiostrongylus cantonensis TaxID=6313 RepID=A0A0K0DKK5_ANGCA